jgi:hypothetical protein
MNCFTKTTKALGIIVLSFVVLLVALYYVNAIFRLGVNISEEARISNPKASIDAVIVRQDGGSLSSDGRLVYVLPRGESIGKAMWFDRDIVFDMEYHKDLAVSWIDDTNLSIRARTRSVYTRQPVIVVDVDGTKQTVTIETVVHELDESGQPIPLSESNR